MTRKTLPLKVEESRNIGERIAYRLAIRELQRHQAVFLQQLMSSQLASHLTLCGSGAIHGVYLHGRPTPSFDFLAPPVVALRFAEMARDAAFDVRLGATANTYEVIDTSLVVPNLRLGVRVVARGAASLSTITGCYSSSGMDAVEVRTLPLATLLGYKLGLMLLRDNPRDYWDLWLGLKHDDSVQGDLKQLLRQQTTSSSNYSPPYPFAPGLALRRLSFLKPIWDSVLKGVVEDPPLFSEVEEDLRVWLPELSVRSSRPI